jgi:trigger factor
VKTEVKTVAENEVELAVEVPQADVQAMIERTIRRLNQESSFPGFRQGKAPRAVVVQRYGQEYIDSQTLNDFLPEWYGAALDEADLYPVSSPEIDFEAFSGDADFAFTAKFSVRPEPTLGQYEGLEVPRRSIAVDDAQVDAQLAMMQERFASLVPVEGRAVLEGDFVQVDFKGTVDGEPIEGAGAEDYMLQVGQGRLIPGFEEALTGVEAGGETEFEVTFPDDYHAEHLRGQKAVFHVKVKEIKEKKVPDLDDEFAKEASEFETLAELRADARERIEAMQETNVEREFRGRCIAAAVENATLSIPEAMIDRQAHGLYHELEGEVGQQGIEMDDYLAMIEKTHEEVEAELRPRAEAIVRQGLVLAAIRDAEGIEASDDDVREYLAAEAQALQRDPTQHILDAHKSGRHDGIRDELVMAKTVDWLVEHSVPIDEPESDDTDEPAEADAQESSSKTEKTAPHDSTPAG